MIGTMMVGKNHMIKKIKTTQSMEKLEKYL